MLIQKITARREKLLVGAISDANGLSLDCHFCGLLVRPNDAQTVHLLPATTSGDVLGSGVALHLGCLMYAPSLDTGWFLVPAGRTDSALVIKGADNWLSWDHFGSFAPSLRREYNHKGCLWCGGHEYFAGVVLNFPVPDLSNRFRLLHIPCIEEMYASQQPEGWTDVQPAGPEELLHAFAELLALN